MHAVTIRRPGDLHVGEVAEPEPGPGDVVLEVGLTGVCGTDLHILDGHFPTARYPVVPGHEVTGRVVRVGAEVTRIAVGARVVVDPGLPCRMCVPCRRGRLNLCEHREAVGVTRAGGAAQRVVVPATSCHVIPEHVPDEVAVLGEPLACVVHALDLVPPVGGERVLVYGAGTIGLLAALTVRHLGAAGVTVVDPSESRRARLARHASVVVAPSADDAPEPEWDLVVDATGVPAAIADGLGRVARGGTFLQIGVAAPTATVEISPYQVFARELRVQGSMTTWYSFPRAVELLASGALDLDGVVGPRVPLAEYVRAIDLARGGEHLKVVVDPRA